MDHIGLGETDRSLIALSLRIAAEKYQTNAIEMRESNVVGNEPIAKVFSAQSFRARELADMIDNADEVSIVNVSVDS